MLICRIGLHKYRHAERPFIIVTRLTAKNYAADARRKCTAL